MNFFFKSTHVFFILLASLFFYASLPAQLLVEKTAYLDVDIHQGQNYRTLKLQNNHLMVMLNSEEASPKLSRVLYFHYFDENLNSIWDTIIVIQKFQRIIDWKTKGNKTFILIQTTKTYHYQLIELTSTPSQAVFKTINWKNIIKKFEINTFACYENKLLLIGEIDNKPNLFSLNLENTEYSLHIFISINQIKGAVFNNIDIDHENEIITVLLVQTNNSHEGKSLYINKYNFEGEFMSHIIYRAKRKKQPLTFRLHIGKNNDFMVLGTFAYKPYSNNSQGVYALYFSQGELKKERFYPYYQLKNFTKNLSSQKQNKLNERISRRLQKDKPIFNEQKVILHKLYPTSNQLILLGEIVDFKYESENRSTFKLNTGVSFQFNFQNFYDKLDRSGSYMNNNINLEILAQNRTSVSSYSYQKGFICAFNLQGRLLWDNLFVFPKNTTSQIPQELLTFQLFQDSILFIQNDEIDINYQVLAYHTFKNRELKKLDYNITNTINPFGFYDSGGIGYWFDNYFLGQGIRGRTAEEKEKEQKPLFFLQKLKYNRNSKFKNRKFQHVDYK